MRVLFAGGGTGGHINPAISIADYAAKQDKDFKALFVGTKSGLETKLVPKAGYDIEYIEIQGFDRKHIFRNSMIPIITMIGPAVAGIFAGSFVIEKMFSIPGLGFYYMKSVSDNDYTMVIGLTIFYAILYVASLIIVDILYGLVDPRIRVANGKK